MKSCPKCSTPVGPTDRTCPHCQAELAEVAILTLEEVRGFERLMGVPEGALTQDGNVILIGDPRLTEHLI